MTPLSESARTKISNYGRADAKKIDGVKRRLPRCYFHVLRAVASKSRDTTYVRVLEHHNDCNYGDSNSSHCRSNIAGTKTEKELHMASRAKISVGDGSAEAKMLRVVERGRLSSQDDTSARSELEVDL